jgi:hypothetical protein
MRLENVPRTGGSKMPRDVVVQAMAHYGDRG